MARSTPTPILERGVDDSGTNSWTLVAGGSTSAFNFRGGHDFRQSTPPAAPIESGDMWIHDAPNGTIDGVYTGISGQIANGQLVLWDGNSYVMVSGTLPGYPDVGDGEGGTLDSRYLKLGANAGNQTVASTGTTTFNGLVEAGGGVRVTGGRSNDESHLAFDERYDRVILKAENAYRGLAINSDGTASIGQGLSSAEVGSDFQFTAQTESGKRGAIRAQGNINTGDKSDNYIGVNNLLSPSSGATNIAKDVLGFSTSFDSSAWNNDPSAVAGNVISFNAGSNHFAPCSGKKIAFNASNANDANAYNFYAGGTASNFFQGNIQASGGVYSSFNPEASGIAADDFEGYFALSTGTGFFQYYCPGGGGNSATKYVAALDFGSTDNRNAALFTQLSLDGTNTRLNGFIAIKGNGGTRINCGVDGDVQTTSDYRLKENVVDMASAVDKVKQLRPVTFDFIGGKTGVDGFLAHELQAVSARAVSGTKDATEAIGTLADYDGTVLETEVTEPSELEYTEDVTDSEGVTTQVVRTRTWTATGTRPVYQGVDQTKLIPLLTKALQEALDRIETLEAAAG